MSLSVKFVGGNVVELKADMVAIGVLAPSDDAKHGNLSKFDGGAQLDDALEGWLSQLIAREQFRGDVGTTRVVPLPSDAGTQYILLVGNGRPNELTLQDMRIIGAKVGQAAECLRLKSIGGVLIASTLNNLGPAARLQALVEGIILGTYRFTKYKTSTEPSTLKTVTLIAGGNRSSLEKAAATAIITAEATCLARDLVNTTAADLTPHALADVAKKVAKTNKLGVSVLTGKALEKERMRLILAVGQGSPNSPAFIHLSYKPKGKAKRKIALVGKGITFDTGGLDLKPAASMITMKDDMGGSAAVLGAMQAIAQLKPNVAVDAYIATAENAIDGDAFRPSDIVKSRNGKTVEVANTDAEGRLVLADALDYAVERKPDVVVDVATLTGGVVVALGEQCTGLFSNTESMAEKMMAAADTAGELMWQMPLLKAYEDGLKSKVADLSSMGKSRASSITAALFLKQFVKGTPWVHLDIAGSAWTSESMTLAPYGGTGAAVRTLIEFCRG
ncbi:MAG: leucyl aminopeptidase [Deltaproteobacteria bacterium CG11_big_fil_rev_8_21_14_0_20_47_16]|nr:MAG: leucyl aminopeptidase [Deltaproteobacteria bacterium CG11_big_fil_rev_8_21_14_0_20_47_16]